MRESRVENHLVREVKKRGGEVRKVMWIGRRHAPDRVILWPNLGIDWVELKAPGKKARGGQDREHGRLRRARQSVWVLDSIEAVDIFMRKVAPNVP